MAPSKNHYENSTTPSASSSSPLPTSLSLNTKPRSPSQKSVFAIFTGVPTVLTLLYMLVLAHPVYQAETKLIVRENKETASSIIPGLAASLLGTGAQTSVEDAYILTAYLHGSQFIDTADQRLGLKAHFRTPVFDPLHTLKKNPMAEEFYDYIRERISIKIAADSNIVSVSAQAFSPEMAHALSKLIIEESEKAINTLNLRMVDSQTALAKKELAQSQATLLEKRRQLLQFQTTHAMVNPESEVTSHLANVAGLDAKLIEKRTELRTKEQYLRPESFEIRAIQQVITALDSQRQHETGTLVTSGDQSMAATLQAYEDLKLQTEFAQQAYSSAFALMETSKLAAGRQEKFLLLIEAPGIPEEPTYPLPIQATLTVFATAAVLFGIGRLTLCTVRDHSI